MDEALRALDRIPLFAGRPADAFEITRLGGLTNRNYKVAVGGETFVLRIAGTGTGDYIDREVEAHNARIAAEAGVNAEVLHFDTGDGTMLCRYVDGVTMDGDRFNRDEGAPVRAARTFKRMHECGRTFRFRFELFAMIDDYLALLRKRGATLPAGYDEVKAEADVVRRAIAANPAPLAPCHNDPLAENFLDTGERMYLVDWEYSGMNDPIWDLGDLSVEAGFGADQDQAMMEAYCGGAVPPAVFGRMVLYKAMCDLLWTLWGLIQHADGNPAEDFWAYAVNRLERCKALMGGADFGRHVDAVRAGR